MNGNSNPIPNQSAQTLLYFWPKRKTIPFGAADINIAYVSNSPGGYVGSFSHGWGIFSRNFEGFLVENLGDVFNKNS